MDSINLESRIREIDFNYALALKQAEKLEEVAERLRMCAAKLEEILDFGRIYWRSENAREYFIKASVWADESRVAASNYVRTATAIRNIAERLYNMEMEAVSK